MGVKKVIKTGTHKEKKKKGGQKMEVRKVIQLRSSLYVNLPDEMCHLWGIEKGDYLTCFYLPGYGVLMTRGLTMENLPFQEARVVRMKQIAENIYTELRRKARGIEARFSLNLYERLISRASKDGLIKLKPKKGHYIEAAHADGFVAGQRALREELAQTKALIQGDQNQEGGKHGPDEG